MVISIVLFIVSLVPILLISHVLYLLLRNQMLSKQRRPCEECKHCKLDSSFIDRKNQIEFALCSNPKILGKDGATMFCSVCRMIVGDIFIGKRCGSSGLYWEGDKEGLWGILETWHS